MDEERYEFNDERRRNWWWAGDEIFDHWGRKLGAIGIALYCFYCRVADSNSQSWYSIDVISQTLAVSVETVRKYNGLLEKYQLISILRGGKGAKDTNVVTVYRRVNDVGASANKGQAAWNKGQPRWPEGSNHLTRSTTHEGLHKKDSKKNFQKTEIPVDNSRKYQKIGDNMICRICDHLEEECTCKNPYS